MNMIREYIKYIRKAKGRHQIHSPYVFDFVNVCIRKKMPFEVRNKLSRLKNRLKKTNEVIHIKDFGAGSKKLGSIRSVKNMYKTSSTKGKYLELLYKISNHYKPLHCLELGTHLGCSSTAIALGNEKSTIITVEACEQTFNYAVNNLDLLNIHNVIPHNCLFDDFIDSYNEKAFDLIFIDGDHRGSALMHYVEKLYPWIHDDTIILIDDIRWNEDMFSAWQTLRNSNTFHLSMDLFKFGVIVKKQGKEKEHFTIRI